MKARETRRTVLLPARMHCDAGWFDARIHNLSARGALAAASDPPPRGAYIDLRVGPHTLTGRIVWQKGRFFGVRMQDRIDVVAVAGDAGPRPRAGADGARVERRAHARLAGEGAAARRVERHHAAARTFRLSLVVAGALAVSVVAGMGVHDLLAGPMAAVRGALAGHG